MFSFVYLLIFFLTSESFAVSTLALKPTKTGGWSLRSDFLADMAQLFHADVFIESGTSYGTTTDRAKNIFNQVHTIELDPIFYGKAAAKFEQDNHVTVYLGDSAILLPAILKKVKHRKILCWLDGHYSGGTTAKGENNTPILNELKAIEEAGRSDAIILIDDICCFKPTIKEIPEIVQGYPSIAALKAAALRINPSYNFIIYGDIAIAYPPEYSIKLSPLIKAMTISRMDDSLHIEELFSAEGIIASQTTPDELEALWDNCTYHFGWHRAHAYVWYALSLFTAERYGEAYDNFIHVLDSGYTHWRVSWYAMQAAYRSGKDYMRFIQELQEAPDKELGASRLFLENIK